MRAAPAGPFRIAGGQDDVPWQQIHCTSPIYALSTNGTSDTDPNNTKAAGLKHEPCHIILLVAVFGVVSDVPLCHKGDTGNKLQ